MLAPIRIIGPIRIKTQKKKIKRKKKKVDRRLSSVAVVAVTLCSAGPSHPNPPHPPLRRPFSYPSFAGALVHAQFSRWPTVRLCVQRLSSLRQHPISLSLFAFATQTPNSSHSTGAFVIPLAINSLAVDNIRSGSKKSSC